MGNLVRNQHMMPVPAVPVSHGFGGHINMYGHSNLVNAQTESVSNQNYDPNHCPPPMVFVPSKAPAVPRSDDKTTGSISDMAYVENGTSTGLATLENTEIMGSTMKEEEAMNLDRLPAMQPLNKQKTEELFKPDPVTSPDIVDVPPPKEMEKSTSGSSDGSFDIPQGMSRMRSDVQ